MMRLRARRRHRHRLPHSHHAAVGIRRYLLCLRRDGGASDTDSDSIPLSSLLDGDNDVADYRTSLLTQMDTVVVAGINPAVCTGLLQTSASSDVVTETVGDVTHRTSVLHSAMPLFTNHLQLPLFTGQRRWHTMFGQLDQLSCRDSINSASRSTDEDILADSNFTSLFDPTRGHDCRVVETINDEDDVDITIDHSTVAARGAAEIADASPPVSENSLMWFTENGNFSAVLADENVDDAESTAEQFMQRGDVVEQSPPQETNLEILGHAEYSHDLCADATQNTSRTNQYDSQYVSSLQVSSSSEPQRLHSRRHSDPGSLRSSTTGSTSTHSNCENWYYYDSRLGPGGVLAGRYGRLQTRRSLSVIVFPPAYDDIVDDVPISQCIDQCTTIPPLSEQTGADDTEQPPPYLASDLPPSYAEVVDSSEEFENTVDPRPSSLFSGECCDCEQHDYAASCREQNRLMMSQSPGMFVGRPAVRWNRNTRVERWTSSFNWVMS